MTKIIVVKVNLQLQKNLLQQAASAQTNTNSAATTTKQRERSRGLLPQSGIVRHDHTYCVRTDGKLQSKAPVCGIDDIYLENTSNIATILEQISLKHANLCIGGFISIDEIDEDSAAQKALVAYTVGSHEDLGKIVEALRKMDAKAAATDELASKQKLDLHVV